MNNRRYTAPETARRAVRIFGEVYKTGIPADISDYEVFHKDGSAKIREMHVLLIRDSRGNAVGFRGITRDVTEKKMAERALMESEQRYRNLFTQTSSPIVIVDPEGNYIDCNDAALSFFECAREELLKKSVGDFLPPSQKEAVLHNRLQLFKTGGTREVEYFVRGKMKYLELAITPTTLKGKAVVFGVGKDMTEYKETEKRLAYMATHDQLTGLPNRVLFNDRLAMEISKARRNDGKLAVMLFDLDHFKDINDTLGHDMGDLLLTHLGDRLKGCLRKSDTVARMGGDEFFLLLPDINSESDVALLAEKILTAIREPFFLKDQQLDVKASLGVSFYPDDGSDPESLIKNADIAMYRAKGAGRDKYRRYRRKATDDRRTIES